MQYWGLFSESITLQAPVTICSFSKLISQFLKAIIDRIWEGSKLFSFGDYLIKTHNPCWGCIVKIIVWTRLQLVTIGKLGPVDLIIHVNGHVFINITSLITVTKSNTHFIFVDKILSYLVSYFTVSLHNSHIHSFPETSSLTLRQIELHLRNIKKTTFHSN